MQDQNRGRSGRQRSVRSEANINAVRESVREALETSVRRRLLFMGLHVSTSSAWRILKYDLKVKPYTISMAHKLTAHDMVRREEMCIRFLDQMESDPQWVNDIWFSDESHFHLSGKVNKTHCIFWGTEKPDKVIQRPLHSQKVTVWAALSSHGLIGPFFFENCAGECQTVNSDRYINILGKFKTALRKKRRETETQWFMQDGATAHTAAKSREWIKQNFDDRVISLKSDFVWAPYSPDLNPLDFFLWGHLKDSVYRDAPQTLIELKNSIKTYCNLVGRDVDLCRRVIADFQRRIAVCRQRNGRHLEHIL